MLAFYCGFFLTSTCYGKPIKETTDSTETEEVFETCEDEFEDFQKSDAAKAGITFCDSNIGRENCMAFCNVLEKKLGASETKGLGGENFGGAERKKRSPNLFMMLFVSVTFLILLQTASILILQFFVE